MTGRMDFGDSEIRLKSCISLASDVDLRNKDVRSSRIAIVGGGMTAANLALGAIFKGAKLVSLCKRRICGYHGEVAKHMI